MVIEIPEERLKSRGGVGGDKVGGGGEKVGEGFFKGGEVLGGEGVDFVDGDELRKGGEGGVKVLEFLVDDLVTLEEVSGAEGVEKVNEKARATDVTEEGVSESFALAGSLDKSGDVTDNKTLVWG